MEIKDDNKPLRILVIGANGGIGRKCVDFALAKGHWVTAVLRTPSKLSLVHPNLTIVIGDVMNPDSIMPHLENQDAVISAVGVRKDMPTSLFSQTAAIILAGTDGVNTHNIFISASAIENSPENSFFIRFITKYLVQKILKNVYQDVRLMETLVKASHSNWTIIRPPRLTDKPLTGDYRFSINKHLKNCKNISRADVAHFILESIGNEVVYKGLAEISY